MAIVLCDLWAPSKGEIDGSCTPQKDTMISYFHLQKPVRKHERNREWKESHDLPVRLQVGEHDDGRRGVTEEQLPTRRNLKDRKSVV